MAIIDLTTFDDITYVFTNIADTLYADDDAIIVWNTGLNAVETGDATVGIDVNKDDVDDPELVSKPVIDRYSYELRLPRTNAFIVLKPGDEVSIKAKDAIEAAYFENLLNNLPEFITGEAETA